MNYLMKAKLTGEVTAVRFFSPAIVRLDFQAPHITAHCRPGQFIALKASDRYDPLLRRPMSLFTVDPRKKTAAILFKIFGPGTRYLANRKKGQTLDFLGPLGNRFVIPARTDRVIIVAGGLGLAPLNFLLEELIRKRKHPQDRLLLLLGARVKEDLVALRKSLRLPTKTALATDDGSVGFRGTVTQLLEKELDGKKNDHRHTVLFACGPEGMLQATCRIANERQIFGQIAVENHMACSFGICMGCMVRCRKKVTPPSEETDRTEISREVYQRACTEGPIFTMHEVVWP